MVPGNSLTMVKRTTHGTAAGTVTVTTRIGANGQIKGHVSDIIDPALLCADPHVRFRAMLQRAFSGELTETA